MFIFYVQGVFFSWEESSNMWTLSFYQRNWTFYLLQEFVNCLSVTEPTATVTYSDLVKQNHFMGSLPSKNLYSKQY